MTGGSEAAARDVLAAASRELRAILYTLDDLSGIDPWIERLDALLDVRPALVDAPDSEPLAYLVFAALTLRQPDHPRLTQWKARVFAIFENHADPSLRIMCGFGLFINGHMGGHRGGMTHFCRVLQQLAADADVAPLASIVERLVTVWHASTQGDAKTALPAFEAGLQLADRNDIHSLDGLLFSYAVTAALNADDTTTAGLLLDRMEACFDRLSNFDRIFFHLLRGWCHLLLHDLGAARFHQERAMAGVEKLGLRNRVEGICRFGAVVTLYAKGETDEAIAELERCRAVGRRIGSPELAYLCDLTRARIALDAGERASASGFLRCAFEAAREVGFLRFTYWQPDVMARLCCFALEEGIAVDFVAALIRRADLFPETPPWRVKHWPWVVRVRTLGGFSLQVDGHEVSFPAKSPKKALELLKAIVACGPMADENRIADQLWPDAEGDSAMRALEITLHRLRRVLGNPTLIRRSEGKLYLDPRRVYVDVRALDELLGEIVPMWNPDDAELADVCCRLAALYGGHFLQGEVAPACIPAMRHALIRRYLQGIAAVGRLCETRGRHDAAVALYQKALEHEAGTEAEAVRWRLQECGIHAGRVAIPLS